MDINCRDCHAWFNRGKVLANLGKYQEALVCYNQALSIKVSYYEAWCEKGVVLEKLGCYQEAEVCFNESLGVFADEYLEDNLADDGLFTIPGEDNASIAYNEACFHSLQGNLEQALANLRKAINLNPDKYLEMVVYDGDLDILRQDRRFRELVKNQENLVLQSS